MHRGDRSRFEVELFRPPHPGRPLDARPAWSTDAGSVR
jgi:hypothetical protein